MSGSTPNPALLVGQVRQIQDVVCQTYQVSRSDLLSDRRAMKVVWPRHVGMSLSREMTELSLPNIGRLFGRRDHTTVIHAIERVRSRLVADPVQAQIVASIRVQLLGHAAETVKTHAEHVEHAQQMLIAAELSLRNDVTVIFYRLREAAEIDPGLVLRRLNEASMDLLEEVGRA